MPINAKLLAGPIFPAGTIKREKPQKAGDKKAKTSKRKEGYADER